MDGSSWPRRAAEFASSRTDCSTPTPVINISDHVNRAVDRGLLGLALDKNFTANGYLYLAYTVERHGQPESTDPRTACITRVTVVGDTASPASEIRILGKDGCGDVDSCIELPVGADCLAADFTSHGNGAIRVDAAGNLWITMGDGSLFNHAIAAGRAQGLDHLNGKLLRVTPLGKGVPSNPFWNGNADAVRSKVYAYGLRNPFRFNAKPGGPVYLGDVGGTRFEEIDVATPGANFGWPCYENNVRHPAYQSHSRCQALYAAGPTAVKAPLHAYSHNGGSAGITGGVFYTGPSTEFNGAYIYADFIKREFRSLRVNAANTAVTSGPTVFGTSVGTPVEIQMGPDGCLWYAAFRTPTIQAGLRRICSTTGNRAPIAMAKATPHFGALPLEVQFSSAGTSDPDGDTLTYLWNFGDGRTGTAVNPRHTYRTKAKHTVTLTVRDTGGLVATWSLTVWAGNGGPVPVIDTPTTDFRFKVRDTIRFSGHATDPEDGPLPASKLKWKAQLVHCPGGTTDCHTHSLLDRSGVASGSWHVDDHGDSYRFELTLTATDSEGLARGVRRTIHPATVTITLASSPTGLSVGFDDVTATAPAPFQAIVNSRHRISFVSPQSGREFQRWSDGGAATHDIVATTSRTFTVFTTARAAGTPRTPG